jgi:hypothetical protein
VNRRAFVLSAAAAAGVTSIPLASAAPGGGPGFHLGAITYNTMKDLDLESIILLMEKVGYEGVELRTGHKHGVEPSISQEERAKVRRRFEQSKIRLQRSATSRLIPQSNSSILRVIRAPWGSKFSLWDFRTACRKKQRSRTSVPRCGKWVSMD